MSDAAQMAAQMAALTPFSDDGWRRLAQAMQSACGLVLPAASALQVAARLAPRLRRLGLCSFDDYLPLLRAETELHAALALLTEPQAGFFREPVQFDLLESTFSRLRPSQPRLWSAAAASGDEAYSLAMLLADLQSAGRIGADWRVLGTDVSERRVRAAAEAVYPVARLRQVAPARLRSHVVGNGVSGLVQVQASLRERVHFERHDVRLPLHGRQCFDAIWLRQVLVYFDAATRRGVLAHVLARLHAGGLLFVGVAEQRLVVAPGLQALGGGVFRKT
jgi:chemotaxis protein methyltransferase CheR